jgi:hypothetical protein
MNREIVFLGSYVFFVSRLYNQSSPLRCTLNSYSQEIRTLLTPFPQNIKAWHVISRWGKDIVNFAVSFDFDKLLSWPRLLDYTGGLTF